MSHCEVECDLQPQGIIRRMIKASPLLYLASTCLEKLLIMHFSLSGCNLLAHRSQIFQTGTRRIMGPELDRCGFMMSALDL